MIPRIAGATPYTVLTGSMEPALPPGTLVVVRPVPADEIGVGSVVTYQLESGKPIFVTHRVVSQGVGDDGMPVFQTQGDANDAPDEMWIRPLQVRGELWYAVPYVGYLSDLFSPHERQRGIYVVAGALLLYAVKEFVSALRARRRDLSGARPLMSSHAAARPRRRGSVLRSARLRALLGLGLVAVLGTTGTFAFWTDDVVISGTTFTAGTIDLQVNGANAITGYTTLNLATMVPGNTVAGVLTIRNNGTASLKYTAVSTATDIDTKNLRGSLEVKVTGATSVTGTSPAVTCAGSALAGTTTTLNGGLLTTGRLLAAGASEILCVQVKLADAAPSSLQGATTDVVLTFTGTSDIS